VLEALVEWQRPARLVIAGEAAFMEGRRYLDHLKRLAAKLKHQHVEFAGHLTGQAKADAFASADLYLFPSIHESYGLTMMEALAHGLPVVATNHAAARATLQPEFSRIVDSPRNLPATLDSLLNSPATLAAMSKAAQAFASQHPFQRAAERVAHTIAAL
jgi:glycosyltransferase involved in cell wall biosynthesis